MRSALLLTLLALPACAQEPVLFEGYPSLRIANGQLTATVLKQGGAIASLTLPGDPQHRNPLWEPIRMARELGKTNSFSGLGHFLCLDGFGSPSKEEQAAGMPFHGEAATRQFEVKASQTSLALSAELPLAQESVARTYTLLPGRPVLQVDTIVTSQLSIDRPMQWAEHATAGSPFLAPNETVMDMSAVKARVRTYDPGPSSLPRRLKSGAEFTWPLAPRATDSGATDLSPVDMRLTPSPSNSTDHTTQLMDPSREWVWFTMMNVKQHLLLGYLFRREEFPWVQSWEDYPPTGKLARGLEFSTQPYDVPRRQTVTLNSLFDTPTYRWFPAKSSVSGHFFVFYTAVPENWIKIDDVRFENGKITVRSPTGSLTL